MVCSGFPEYDAKKSPSPDCLLSYSWNPERTIKSIPVVSTYEQLCQECLLGCVNPLKKQRDAPDPFAVSITQPAFWDYTCDLRDIADNSTYLPFCSLAFPRASHQVPKSI